MFQETIKGLLRTRLQTVTGRVVNFGGRAFAGLTNIRVPSRILLGIGVCASGLVALPALSAGLNDTGISACGAANTMNDANCASVAPDGGAYPRQDARYGRDAQAANGLLPKTGAGAAGFDFSKIGNNGSVLAAGAVLGTAATQWACTRDNVTGLIWEVKATSGLRDQNNTYSWYQSSVGTSNGGTCSSSGNCDTEKFTAEVNASALCGYQDWRLPTAKELQSIVKFSQVLPSIDVDYFPNTSTVGTKLWWTGTRGSLFSYAWFVDFGNGGASTDAVASKSKVRLVRGAL